LRWGLAAAGIAGGEKGGVRSVVAEGFFDG
jgi:hypothetical protein